MSDVFVSYKAEDRRRVTPLVDALEAEGYSVWWDEQIGGGAAWRHTIETELSAAKSVIVVWSKRSVGPEGTFVQDEAARAQQRRVYVPVTIDKVHLPIGFGETQALPLAGWRGNRADPRFQAVLAAVRRVAGESDAPAPRQRAKTPVTRRTVVTGGVVAAAALGGGGVWMLLKHGSTEAASRIAVLPFANLSGDPAQDYFSDGMAEELRSALARLGGLQVVGRTSSEAVSGEDATTAAKKLGVANILIGSVRQSPSTIRVNAQLVDGRNGLERWSQHYDREPGDVIRIQTDIAQSVARALVAALGASGLAALTVGGTQNPEARRLFLLAADESRKADTPAAARQALALTDAAIDADPAYADAYALKSQVLNMYAGNFPSGPAELSQVRKETLQFARKALNLAPNLPRAHLALANYYQGTLNIAPSGVEFERALELAPGDSAAIRGYSAHLMVVGDPEKSLQLADRIVALDPLNARSYSHRLEILFDSRRFGEAVRFGRELKRNSPEMLDRPTTVADSYVMLGQLDEARQFYRLAAPDFWMRLLGEAFLSIRAGDRAGATRKLMRMRELYGDAASYQYAEIHAQFGDAESAFAALDRAWRVKDSGLTRIRVDPWLDPLRNDTRLARLIKAMNFPA